MESKRYHFVFKYRGQQQLVAFEPLVLLPSPVVAGFTLG